MSRAREAAEGWFHVDRQRGRPRKLRVGSRILLPSQMLAVVTGIGEDAGGPFLELQRADGELLDLRPVLARWWDGSPL